MLSNYGSSANDGLFKSMGNDRGFLTASQQTNYCIIPSDQEACPINNGQILLIGKPSFEEIEQSDKGTKDK